jgi:hypothetical protein
LFRDEIWLHDADPSKLVELARDAVLLAAVFNDERTFRGVLDTIMKSLRNKVSVADREAVAAAALVAWKSDVAIVAPWLEMAILSVVRDVDGDAFLRLQEAIDERRFASLPKHNSITSHQPWRAHALSRRMSKLEA